MLQDAEEWTARTRSATKSATREREGRKGGAGGGRQGRPPRGRKAHAPRAKGAGLGGGAKRRGAVAPRHTAAWVPLFLGVGVVVMGGYKTMVKSTSMGGKNNHLPVTSYRLPVYGGLRGYFSVILLRCYCTAFSVGALEIVCYVVILYWVHYNVCCSIHSLVCDVAYYAVNRCCCSYALVILVVFIVRHYFLEFLD